jgi:ABC-type dipeptide/oligopeptide/nickel transport system ATPase component
MAGDSLLDIGNLRISFGPTRAVDGVSISVAPGELVGIVGESGSGKSTLARAILDLLPGKAAVEFDRFAVSGRAMRRQDLPALRGSTVAMIFQDPLSYLNPLMTVGRQIEESVSRYDARSDVPARVRDLLALVRLPIERYHSYPHELSGGMRQRVLIAIALGCKPRMLIADEPTTALDVTTQAEILGLLKDLSRDLGMALLLISHDLGVIASLCERLYVMRYGKVVEEGPLRAVFSNPQHVYTRALLNADRAVKDERGRFVVINADA